MSNEKKWEPRRETGLGQPIQKSYLKKFPTKNLLPTFKLILIWCKEMLLEQVTPNEQGCYTQVCEKEKAGSRHLS